MQQGKDIHDWTNKEALHYLNQVIEKLKKIHYENTGIELDIKLMPQLYNDIKKGFDNYNCGNGNTRIELFSEIKDVTIGDYELESKKDEKINIACFTETLVTILHENAHVEQVLYLSKNSDCLSKYITLGRASRCFDELWYLKTYYQQPHEIQASFKGINDSFQLLKKHFGESVANELICGYVNNRIDQNALTAHYVDGSYIIDMISCPTNNSKKKYTNVESYLQDLNNYFLSSINKAIDIDFKTATNKILENKRELLENKKELSKNDLKKNLNRYDIFIYGFNRISNAKTGLHQHLFAADSYFLQLYNLFGKNYIDNVIQSTNALEGFGLNIDNRDKGTIADRLSSLLKDQEKRLKEQHIRSVNKRSDEILDDQLPQSNPDDYSLFKL